MSQPRVLLVEDDPLDASLARRALKAAGVTSVEHCSTVAAVLERLADATRPAPTVLLLDLSLPDSEGIDTFDRLAEAGAPPIVVMSGDDDPFRALALIERGAQDYLVKGEMSGAAIARSLRQAVERARLIAELEEARDRALLAARAQGAFVAAMSHEIRTPLNAILGMSDLLAQTRLDLDQREYVEIFRRCGKALKGLLDNALELSRFETGSVELMNEPFELDALIHECLEAFAFAAHRQRVALVGDVSDDAVGSVEGDEGRLRQVLFNLVGNAVKFTSEGRVVVRARSDADGVVIEIEDTGIGIPEERLEAVFERFVQAESGTTRRFGGSGLGLALCRELVRAMGGEIGVTSRVGEGSCFRVRLPLRVEPRPRPRVFADRRVLVLLEDDAEQSAAASHLRARGAEVESVRSIEEAETALGSGRHFDAALLDARLPGSGGLELLERLDPDAALQRVVLLPMDHRVGDLGRCEAAGAIALCKPARWDELDRALQGRAPAAGPAGAGPAVPRLAGLRVLVAEDVPENRTVVLAHLAPTGCETVVAKDGIEAAERCREGGVDLVLMDVHMPRLDGCEAARRIRTEERAARRPRVPIVAITADALPEQRAACLTAGCDAHLGKPFTREDLYTALREVLGEGVFAEPAADGSRAPAAVELPEIPPELADLAEGYLANRRGDADALVAAVAAGDLASARRLGHNMKGSGAGYGFARVSELGAQIETAAKAGDAAEVERLARALGEFAEKMLGALGASG